jgi:uncharacterized protein YkwD
MLRYITLILLFGAMGTAIWSTACAPPPRRLYAAPAPDLPAAEIDLAALINRHNRERAEAELPPLKTNAELEAAAKLQAQDMASQEKMAHTGSDGSTPAQRVERAGYHLRKTGENVAFGQTSVEEVMRSWMNSRRHKENILGDFTEIGVAVAYAKDGTPYWCVDFGRPWPKLNTTEATEAAILQLNTVRAESEKPKLAPASELRESAQQHAGEMAENGTLKKKDEAGQSTLEKLARKSKRYRSLREADTSGAATAEELVKGWLEQKGQKEIILGDFDELGMGYAATKNGQPFWCLLVGKLAN